MRPSTLRSRTLRLLPISLVSAVLWSRTCLESGMYPELIGISVTNKTRINNYKFDMDVMTSFEGDTGPYLQYAHARLCSIRRRVGLSDDELATANYDLLTEKHATDLVRLLSQWPDVVQ